MCFEEMGYFEELGYVPPPKCRAKQLYEAGEKILDTARMISLLSESKSFADFQILSNGLATLKHQVEVFDRLNRGL